MDICFLFKWFVSFAEVFLVLSSMHNKYLPIILVMYCNFGIFQLEFDFLLTFVFDAVCGEALYSIWEQRNIETNILMVLTMLSIQVVLRWQNFIMVCYSSYISFTIFCTYNGLDMYLLRVNSSILYHSINYRKFLKHEMELVHSTLMLWHNLNLLLYTPSVP